MSKTQVTFSKIVDLLTLPERFIVDVAETFGQGFVDFVNGKTCRAISEISIPGVHAIILECIGTPAFQSVFHTIQQEITDFLKYPVIREGWHFLNTPVSDIPVIGEVMKEVNKGETWIFNNVVPWFARRKIQDCIQDGMKNPSDDPLFFILGIGLNMVQHPTILDMLLAIPGVGELAETIKASEFAVKAAKVAAASADGAESIAKAVEASEKAATFADAAKGTEYEAAAAEHAVKARKAVGDTHYKGKEPAEGHRAEGGSKLHEDATAIEGPHVPDEGAKIVEDAGLKAANQAELDEALKNTWSENDLASQAQCKRAPGLKCLKNWGKPQYKVFDNVPTLQDLSANIREYGKVKKGDSLFYSSLDGQNGVTLSTQHYKRYIQKSTQRQGFAIDRATDKKWSRAQMGKMKTPAMVDRFGRRLSQAFAENAQGDVYFFTRSGLDGTAFPANSVWGGWEYPALTRNPRVTKIIQVDPFMEGDLGHTIWTPDKGPSPNAPKSGS
ncbi:hypothetical protein BDV32DRAFT_156016 [Aspergillus pseudonomiae]|nr:hypothetical protein BDV32DRAFT_156016 [Aspergillus pseudonomiae]